MNDTCGKCKHWIERPIDPNNVKAPRPGECRAQPPQLVMIPTNEGFQLKPFFPLLLAESPACGLFTLPLLQG